MDAIAINLRSVAAHERDHNGQGALARLIEAAADEIEALRTCVAEAVAAEREACAKIADSLRQDGQSVLDPSDAGIHSAASVIAATIRARGAPTISEEEKREIVEASKRLLADPDALAAIVFRRVE